MIRIPYYYHTNTGLRHLSSSIAIVALLLFVVAIFLSSSSTTTSPIVGGGGVATAGSSSLLSSLLVVEPVILSRATGSNQQRQQQRQRRMMIGSNNNLRTLSTMMTTTSRTRQATTRTTTTRTTTRSISSTSSSSITTTSSDLILPLGDVNVIVVTDDHSWLGGHKRSSDNYYTDDSADYGNVLSFYETLKEYCTMNNKDLWFVMNGDWIDGTGLSMNQITRHLLPLIEKIPYDAVNVGNHELYHNAVIQTITQPGGFVEWWGPRFLSSNTRRNSTTNSRELSFWNHNTKELQPLGNNYMFLRGKQSTVLVFGFIFNMDDPDTLVVVEEIETVVQQKWFTNALTNPKEDTQNEYQSILVLAHMGCTDPLVEFIVSSIRDIIRNDDMPIQVLAGHTHIRDYQQLQRTTSVVEAGKYLETIGFVSFPTLISVLNAKELAKNQPPITSTETTVYPTTAPIKQTTSSTTTNGTSDETKITTTSLPTTSPIATTDSPVVITTTTSVPTITPVITTETPSSLPTPGAVATTTVAPSAESNHNNNSTRLLVNDRYLNNIASSSSSHSHVTTNTSSSSSTSLTGTVRTDPVRDLFQHVFMDVRQSVFQQIIETTTGRSEYDTERGMELSKYIERTRTELGLTEIVGCMPDRSYYLNRSMFAKDSLWRLFTKELVPSIFTENQIFLLEKGTWRYDLFQGDVTIDDVYGVSPYNTTFVQFFNISTDIIIQLNATLNNPNETHKPLAGATTPNLWLPELPNYILASAKNHIEPDTTYTLIVMSWDEKKFIELIESIDPSRTIESVVPLIRITSTDLWMNFIVNNYPGPCSGSIFSGFGGNSGGGSGSTSHGKTHSGFSTSSNAADDARILFSVIALIVVVVGMILLIRQKSRVYANVTAVKQHATMSALREYEDRINDDSDDDDDENYTSNHEDDDFNNDYNDPRNNENDGIFVNDGQQRSSSSYKGRILAVRNNTTKLNRQQPQQQGPPKDLLDDADEDPDVHNLL